MSRKKGKRISPITAVIANKNSVDNIVRQKTRSSVPNAGSNPSSLKPLNEDEVRVFEDLDPENSGSENLPELSEKVNTLFQSAYHGSPHRFANFSLDAIGTGEDAQAHGWGCILLKTGKWQMITGSGSAGGEVEGSSLKLIFLT